MIKATRVGHTLICVIKEKIYQKVVDSDEQLMAIYEQALNTDENDAQELNELIAIFQTPKTAEELQRDEDIKKMEKEVAKQADLLQWLEDIKMLGDEHFEVSGIKLYMKGINITVPEFLAEEFAHRRNNEEDLNSLLNFWRLCALNPDPRCREDLYGFLMKNDISITPSGYFITYRNVVLKELGNKELNDFVARKWLQVKKWKKNVMHYSVYENTDSGIYEAFLTTKEIGSNNDDDIYQFVGNLGELYEASTTGGDSSTIYTDAHTRSFTIKLGEVVSMDRSLCDGDPDRTCSNGLHLGNLNFMRKGSFGSEGLVCLCNPKDVVAVPTSYDGKMRVCSYLPISLADYDSNGYIIPVDTATFEYEYAEHTQEELEKMIATSRFESLKEHEIIPKEINLDSLKRLTLDLSTSLEEMNKAIQTRIINV